MADEPLISIILPVYNGNKYLSEAIKSCLDQTYTNLELIIVDDASTDDSLLIAQEWQARDNRIRIISNKENLTLPVSLNIGHKQARGKYLTWTSDDNLFQKDAIKYLYKILVNKDVDIVYSDYLIFDKDDVLVRESRLKDIEYLLLYGVIGTCFLYKKEVYARNGGYDENLFLVEDYDFWLKSLKHSKFFRIKNPGYYYYRQHKDSLTGRMAMNSQLKAECHENLRTSYSNLFLDYELNNKEEFIEILFNWGKGDRHNNIKAVKSKHFFKDLEIVSNSFKDFSYFKIKRIFIEDAVETILKKKEFHKISVFVALHRTGKREILRLPIERYLALAKKCLF